MRAKGLGSINGVQNMIIHKLRQYTNNLELDNQKSIFEEQVKHIMESKESMMGNRRQERRLRRLARLI